MTLCHTIIPVLQLSNHACLKPVNRMTDQQRWICVSLKSIILASLNGNSGEGRQKGTLDDHAGRVSRTGGELQPRREAPLAACLRHQIPAVGHYCIAWSHLYYHVTNLRWAVILNVNLNLLVWLAVRFPRVQLCHGVGNLTWKSIIRSCTHRLYQLFGRKTYLTVVCYHKGGGNIHYLLT